MGGCGCCQRAKEDPDDPGHKELKESGQLGPAKNRGCTDIFFLLLWLGHWCGFFFVTFLDVSSADPTKLYQPRDYRGDYCDIADNWADGINLKGFPKLTYTMNVTQSVDMIAKQLVCSSAAEAILTSTNPATRVLTDAEITAYECACCLFACSTCYGSLDVPDVTLTTASGIISGKMNELRGFTSAAALFSPTGLNSNTFSDMWAQATIFFNAVCLKECNTPSAKRPTNSSTSSRFYTYSPPPDYPWRRAWDVLKNNSRVDASIQNLIKEKFTFQALPMSECPYHERYCIPFPGVDFEELQFDYCTFKMSSDVMNAVGDSAAKTFEDLGANSIVDGMSDSIGTGFGDLLSTLHIFALVAVCSMVIGLIFIVVLRFFVKICVWCSIFSVLAGFVLAGGLLFVRSSQCNGAGLFDSGEQMGNAIVSVGTNVAAGNDIGGEAMTGNGEDYRGVQTMTQTGKTCQNWADQNAPHNHTTTPVTYPDAGLVSNYCRNPQSAPTIWCFTTDRSVRWELCSPIGVIRPGCPQGYVISSETVRKFVEVCAYIVWGFGFIWLLLVCCLRNQIRLAIGINVVAAKFVFNTKQIIFVPILQIIVGILWCLAWLASISFMLSQVPAEQVPTRYFTTFQEAYGTDDEPGACTDQAIPGFVWKSEGNLQSTNDPCSGNQGTAIPGQTPACWRCGPPRFIFDWRFFVSLFTFLWNNAFLVALGQCIIAGAVSVWFFLPHQQKTKGTPVRTATWNCFRYHLGSLAFGSFILAVVQLIRYIMRYLEAQATAQKNRFMACVLRVVQCCLWCFERCIKFLNKNAYIQIALVGKNFCISAYNAFQLWLKNLARFGIFAVLGTMIHLIGFMFIMAATCVSGYFILKATYPNVTPVIPMISYIILSYIVAKLYMNVFGLAVDSCLHCFLIAEDLKRDGETTNEYCPPALARFMREDKEEDGIQTKISKKLTGVE